MFAKQINCRFDNVYFCGGFGLHGIGVQPAMKETRDACT
jgi:glycine/D-amino acid oxidase-like deaminating enzyme